MSGSCCPNLCPECGLLHHNATVEGCLRIQVKALRAEVAALKAELSREDEPHDYCHHCGGRFGWLRAEIARLEAELAKYTEPLTQEQVLAVHDIFVEHGVYGNWQDRDAAIRRVRKGE